MMRERMYKKILGMIVLGIGLWGCSNVQEEVLQSPVPSETPVVEDTPSPTPEMITMEKPDDFPEYLVMGEASVPGRFLMAINSGAQHYLADFNEKGELLWYDVVTDETSLVRNRSAYRKAEKDGLYYFFERVPVRNNRYVGAKLVIFDDYGQTTEHFYLLNGVENPIDPHDAVVFDHNHYIIETSIGESEEEVMQHSYIQEVKDGAILWEFCSANYPDLMEERYVVGDNDISLDDRGDYMHFNSFALDSKDNNLLVSYRNQSAIFKIDRTTGEILWKCGGNHSDFDMSQIEPFSYQHSISLQGDHLLLFNNGKMEEEASIMEFVLNETEKTITYYRTIPLHYYVSNYGEVIKNSRGNYFVQRGQSPSLDRNSGIDEVDSVTGDVIFSLEFKGKTNSYWFDFIPN